MTGASAPDPGAGLRLDLDGPVATVTLDRPEVLNAQTPQMWLALRDIGKNLPGDVRAVIVRGEGRAFSAGLDVKAAGADGSGGGTFAEIVGATPAGAEDRIATFQEAFSWLRSPSLITVAAVQGHAIGAGFQLALACDFRVLAEDAKLTMAEVTLGLVPDLSGTKRLADLVGYSRALEICVTGRRVPADEAVAMGLANLVVSHEHLDGAVRDLVDAILQAPRDAVVEIKALLSAAGGNTFAQQEALERAAQVRRIRDLAGLGE